MKVRQARCLGVLASGLPLPTFLAFNLDTLLSIQAQLWLLLYQSESAALQKPRHGSEAVFFASLIGYLAV